MQLDIAPVRHPLVDHVMLQLPNIRKDQSGLEKVQKAVSRMLRDTKSLSVMYKTYKDFTFFNVTK